MNNNYKIIFVFMLLGAFIMPSVSAVEVSQSELDRKVMDISKQLRCAVCQNQPVSESNSGLAKDMRGSIREQLEVGKNEKEIIDYFVVRYGDYILMKPRQDGIGLPLWILPPILLLMISLFVFIGFKSRRNQNENTPLQLDAEDIQRVRQARENRSERKQN